MRRFVLYLFVMLPALCCAQRFSKQEVERYEAEAKRVTIVRDNWGVPHIYGKTDADAVFGLMYTQCEENFKGIERNYMYQLGRQAEVDGENSLYTDVQLQLIADSADAIKDYNNSPKSFKKLLDAFADGLNYYLYKHPEVKPQVFQKYQPWYALMFTDGSVAATMTGGINLNETQRFYSSAPDKLGAVNNPDAFRDAIETSIAMGDAKAPLPASFDERETGSNGFAISPYRSVSGNAMLYINPHVPFYFRSEVQMVSDEGLNAYGAVTWGQFFIYQGFNAHCGWMHTSSNADVADLYAEKVIKVGDKWVYEYDGGQKPVTERKLTINIRKDGKLQPVTITGYYTHHGPVLAARNGKWLALKHNNRSYEALLESWLITKAKNFDQYKKAMDLLNNATNNTVYADDKGNIAFWYGNFMPKRDKKIDWTQPVNGSVAATEWQGLHKLDEIVHVYNPATGYIQNCNSTPYTSAGISSPDKNRYPAYMAPNGENFRAVNAIKLLGGVDRFTLDDLITKGYDKYLAAFDVMLPPLFKAFNSTPDSVKQLLAEPIQILQAWDKRSAINSVATTLAVEWGTRMMANLPRAASGEASTFQTVRVSQMMKNMQPKQMLAILSESVNDLQSRYGTWKIHWGDINRYQRPADGGYDDAKASIPVAQVSSAFGQLPSFQSRVMPGTKNRYGFSGNSFIAAVEFGPRLKAKTIITGGQYFDPKSKHFTDQSEMFIEGKFKDVLFYKEDVLKHAEKTYHPGE